MPDVRYKTFTASRVELTVRVPPNRVPERDTVDCPVELDVRTVGLRGPAFELYAEGNRLDMVGATATLRGEMASRDRYEILGHSPPEVGPLGEMVVAHPQGQP